MLVARSLANQVPFLLKPCIRHPPDTKPSPLILNCRSASILQEMGRKALINSNITRIQSRLSPASRVAFCTNILLGSSQLERDGVPSS